MEEHNRERFAVFSEEERALLGLGITLAVMEFLVGIVAGPVPADEQARAFPILVRMMNEIGATFDLPSLDPALMELMNEKLAAQAGDAP